MTAEAYEILRQKIDDLSLCIEEARGDRRLLAVRGMRPSTLLDFGTVGMVVCARPRACFGGIAAQSGFVSSVSPPLPFPVCPLVSLSPPFRFPSLGCPARFPPSPLVVVLVPFLWVWSVWSVFAVGSPSVLFKTV